MVSWRNPVASVSFFFIFASFFSSKRRFGMDSSVRLFVFPLYSILMPTKTRDEGVYFHNHPQSQASMHLGVLIYKKSLIV